MKLHVTDDDGNEYVAEVVETEDHSGDVFAHVVNDDIDEWVEMP